MSSKTDVADYVRRWTNEGTPLSSLNPAAGRRDDAAGHVVLAGGSGLIGGALAWALTARGTRVTRLVRRTPHTPDERQWDPSAGHLDPALLEGADAVICLNGASVGRLPWTASYRETLIESRLRPTRTIVDALRSLGKGSPALITASAVGYYGSQPGTVLTETSGVGSTFLAHLCAQWEAEARRAASVTRVAHLRTAPVIDRDGVLKPMLALTALGLGGPLGHGTQIWPWISLEDEVRAIMHVLDQQLEGPVNLCGPVSATANEIGRELAARMRRPFWLPAPAFALRLALSQEATESLLLSDADVKPEALTAAGFTFKHPTVAEAVEVALRPR